MGVENARVTGLRIVNRSWAFGPLYNLCSKIDRWEAKLVTLEEDFRDEDSSYRIAREVGDLPCNEDTY